MSHHFALGQERAQWVSSGFMVAMTVSMLTTPWLLGALRLSPHLRRDDAAADGGRPGRRVLERFQPGAGGAGGRRAGGGRGAADPRDHHPARLRARPAGARQRHLRHGRRAGAGARPQHRRRAGGPVRLALDLLHGRAVLPGVDVARHEIRAGDSARRRSGAARQHARLARPAARRDRHPLPAQRAGAAARRRRHRGRAAGGRRPGAGGLHRLAASA